MTWTQFFSPDDQERLTMLKRLGCRLCMRKRLSDQRDTALDESSHYWLEIWRGSELLAFAGPVPWPLAPQYMHDSGVSLLDQAHATLKAQR